MALTTLFLDLNAYFASVEQQVHRELRGRPIAVAPITGDSGCCIAVSYEAKAFGVKTGTRVGEARALCPGIEIVDARPRLYVLMHQRVLRAIDACLPVQQVHSIDEVSCRLDPTQRDPEIARGLATRIKASISRHCGVAMRCSIGIAPNRVLAKLGTDLMKPDGLVIFRDADLPGAIASLSPQQLAGIGPRMMRRLELAGITTVADLLARSEKDMELRWGGVVGRRWWHWLRGHEVPERATRKGSVGHQHVLAPEVRHHEGARAVAFRLALKAAARLRHDSYAARTVTLALNFQPDRRAGPAGGWQGEAYAGGWGEASWSESASLGSACADTPTILDALGALWERVPRDRVPMMVGVTLHDLVAPTSQTLPLFSEEARRSSLSRTMDLVNRRFGANTVYTANIQDARAHGTGGIAFSHVPDLGVADSVTDRMRGSSTRLTDEQLDAMIEESLDH